MSFWGLVQIFIDIVLLATIGFLWAKLSRPQKDDPRLSRGLQLLGSKISILEDLSDRTETQVKQLTSLMEQKVREIQTILLEAENQIQKIDQSMIKSLEVAKIFQDKIPHQEIIERQNTIKYVKAARMAHQGASIEEIVSAVDLPRGEIEFIAKVNRDQLQFSEQDLPAWAKQELAGNHNTNNQLFTSQNLMGERSGFSAQGSDEGAADQQRFFRVSPTQATAQAVNPLTNEAATPLMQASSGVRNEAEPLVRRAGQLAEPTRENGNEGINQSPTLKSLGEKFRQAMHQQSVPQSFQQTMVENLRPSELRPPGAAKTSDKNADRNTIKKVIFPRIDY